jgi:hypothetical protein
LAPAGHREIDAGQARRAALELALAGFDRLLELALEGVRRSPDLFALLGVETGDRLQDFGEGTILTPQELGLELLEPAFVGVRDLLETFPQRV